MRIRKFTGSDVQEAVTQVKREMGPDAMIVATRQVRRGLMGKGVEVTAAIDVDEPEPPDPEPIPMAAVAPVDPVITEEQIERFLLPLRSEIRSLRTMLRPVATRTSTEELRTELVSIRQAIAAIQPDPAQLQPLPEVVKQHRVTAPSDRRIVALVGPTGVGKTTTIAKLAARAALVEQRKVAIVTLDAYRVGGEEQMRTFADLIGVPLVLIEEPSLLKAKIAQLSRYERIFIDTAGRSPRDVDAFRMLERTLGELEELEVHLVMSATSTPAMIDAWSKRYHSLGIDRLLFTKLDEATEAPELIRAPVRINKPVTYLTTGQRVPEDLEEATPERLLELATVGLAAREVAA